MIDESGCVMTAVSAPLLDVLASAAVEQPPLEMPVAASAIEPQINADIVAEPMPTVSADAAAVEAAPDADTKDTSSLTADDLSPLPVAMATPRFLLLSVNISAIT